HRAHVPGRRAAPESRVASPHRSRPDRARRRRPARPGRGPRHGLALHALARRVRCSRPARRSRLAPGGAGGRRGDAPSLGARRRARARAGRRARAPPPLVGAGSDRKRGPEVNVVYAVLLLGSVPAAAEILKRRLVGPTELLRKTVHIGDGLLAAALPVFVSFRAIAGIALFFAGAMAISRRRGIFTAVHDVERRSYGEIFYPLGIALLATFFPHW